MVSIRELLWGEGPDSEVLQEGQRQALPARWAAVTMEACGAHLFTMPPPDVLPAGVPFSAALPDITSHHVVLKVLLLVPVYYATMSFPEKV